jgi:MFS family permease
MSFAVGFFPLLYVATALAYMLLALPVGLLADRLGRPAVFLGGYVVLLITYSSLLFPVQGPLWLLAYLLLLGAYYAATDGVLMAIASVYLAEDRRAGGLGLLTTATSLARLCSSMLFGLLWTWWGVESAVTLFGVALVLALLGSAVPLIRSQKGISDA